LLDHRGDTTPRRLFEEILALSKMNFNNVDFADGNPITTRFAQRIGEILAYMKEGENSRLRRLLRGLRIRFRNWLLRNLG
jgi:hypothetical protein